MPFEAGDVIAIYTDRSYDTKYKFVIVVAAARSNDNYLCVFINSNQARPYLIRKFQPCFEVNDRRTYLHHTSYIDCYDPEEFTERELQKSIDTNPKNFLGKASDEDLDLIKDLVKENPQIPKGLKKAYFYIS